MVTWTKKVRQGEDANGVALYYCEGFCLSTDTKPTTGIANGSNVLEMDTGDAYAFNQAGTAWVKL